MTDRQQRSIDDAMLRQILLALRLDYRAIAKAVASELRDAGALDSLGQHLDDDLTIDRAIAFLGEGRTKIYERINAGQLVAYRRGRKTVLTRESAERTRQTIREEGRQKIDLEHARRAARRLHRGTAGKNT